MGKETTETPRVRLGGSRWKWLALGAASLVTVVGALLFTLGGGAGSENTSETSRPDAGGLTSPNPVPSESLKIQKSGFQEVSKKISQRWEVEFQERENSPVGSAVMTVKRPAGGETFIAIAPQQKGSDDISMILCRITGGGSQLNEEMLGDLETCLLPVLTDTDKAEVLTQVQEMADSLSGPGILWKVFDRLKVVLSIQTDNDVYLKVAGPGRNGP